MPCLIRVEKVFEVPMPAVRAFNRIVGKAVQFVQFQPGAVINPGHDAATPGAEVNRQTYFSGASSSLLPGHHQFPAAPMQCLSILFSGGRSVIKVSTSPNFAKK